MISRQFKFFCGFSVIYELFARKLTSFFLKKDVNFLLLDDKLSFFNYLACLIKNKNNFALISDLPPAEKKVIFRAFNLIVIRN